MLFTLDYAVYSIENAKSLSCLSTEWGKNKFTIVSMWNTEFILVLLFINYCIFSIQTVNLLLHHPVFVHHICYI